MFSSGEWGDKGGLTFGPRIAVVYVIDDWREVW
jgi:hypothetical protein